jgi:hypothetical protein
MSETFEMIPAKGGALGYLGVIGLVMLGLLLLFAWFSYSSRNTQFAVSSEGLRISGTMYGRLIPADRIRKEQIRPVDLTLEPDLNPKWRTNGIGLPGYLAGWFKLRNGEKALLFVTDKNHVVCIPTTDGYALLISVPDPARFMESVKTNIGNS